MIFMNAIEKLLNDRALKPIELARLIGCSRSHISHLRSGNKTLHRPMAIAIYRKIGAKIGPIADLSDSDIEVLERVLVNGQGA